MIKKILMITISIFAFSQTSFASPEYPGPGEEGYKKYLSTSVYEAKGINTCFKRLRSCVRLSKGEMKPADKKNAEARCKLFLSNCKDFMQPVCDIFEQDGYSCGLTPVIKDRFEKEFIADIEQDKPVKEKFKKALEEDFLEDLKTDKQLKEKGKKVLADEILNQRCRKDCIYNPNSTNENQTTSSDNNDDEDKPMPNLENPNSSVRRIFIGY